MQAHSTRHLMTVALVVLMCTQVHCQETQVSAADVDFDKDVRPILQEKCVECHEASLQMADLRLDSRQAMLDADVMIPGDAQSSLLLQRLEDRDLGVLMPPTGRLSKAEVETLRKWVNSGATWPNDITLSSGSLDSKADARSQSVFEVIRSNDLDAIETMLRDPSLVHVTNKHGATPLMHAALHSSEQIVRSLLDHGADPNAADDDGMTALMYAVGGDLAKVRLLLEQGANVNAKSKLGRTVLLMASAYAGNTEIVKTLLDAGADVHFADGRGWTSVVMAARTGDVELVRLLLDAGGDVNGGDSKRLSPGTPLMQAAWISDVELAKMLLARGAKQDQRSLNTALIYAATHGSLDLVEQLLDSGADPRANVVTNYVPQSPILAAAYSDSLNTEIVKVLLNHDVDVSKKDERGETPLSMAIQRGPSPIAKLLGHSKSDDASAEARPESTSAKGLTDVTVKQLAQKSVRLLQSSGPQFYAKSGCVACHQQTAASLVVQMARRRGLEIDEQTEIQQRKLTAVDLGRKRVGFHQRMKVGGAAHRLGYLLWGLAAADYPADEITDAAYVELAGLQLHNGSWVSDAHRPPTEYSPVTATSVSLRAIQLYTPPGMASATKDRVARATEWLVEAPASANAEKAFRLLGLHWGGAEKTHLEKATKDLLMDQADSGGWSQLPDLQPDAYATGLTLYALGHSGGLPVTDAAYRKGATYLLSTAGDDGSWHVRSRSFKFQPYFESGFPHEHDQWISTAATGWATMALLQTIEPNQ